MGRVWIPGTPTYDGNSYMKSGTCYYSWTSMPHYDEIALKYLFPILNYTIHFENSTLNDLVVPSSSTGYYLDRRIFPKMNGYSFRGWRHDPTLFAEYDYSTPIKNKFKTLYAKWEPIGNLHSSTCTSYEGQSSILFTLPYTSVVIITSTVFRGMNSWNDLKTHNDTYTKIENTGYSQQYSLTNYMNGLSTEPSIVHTDTLVLSSGSYTLTSSLTTALGQQNVSNGNHGSVLIKVDYY